MAAPMPYTVGGRQYVAVMAGFGGASNHHTRKAVRPVYENRGRIIAFKLGGRPFPHPQNDPRPAKYPPHHCQRLRKAPSPVASYLYAQQCGFCHGLIDRENESGYPNLAYLTSGKHQVFKQIVLEGALRAGGHGQLRRSAHRGRFRSHSVVHHFPPARTASAGSIPEKVTGFYYKP